MISETSHRERVLLALEHKETDRVPIAMVCSMFNQPAYVELTEYLRQTRNVTVEEYLKPLLDIDTSIRPKYIGPPRAENEDSWGVIRKPISYGPGSYDEIEHYPLAGMDSIDQIMNYCWPSTDWFDYSVIADKIRTVNSREPYCILVNGGNLFETSWYMRGFEQALMDSALGPELFHAIIKQVTEFYLTHTRKQLEAADGQIDLVFTADDIGGQEGLLMSLDLFRRHIKPYHEKLNALIHSFGAKVIYHTDGAVMDGVADLVDMGIDVLQALQFDAKAMDPVALKTQYGEKLCFQGGISIQKTLPFGSAGEVRQEVIDRITVLGRNGGYILGPSHAIQAGTPAGNIVMMFETASRHGSCAS